MKDKKIEIIGSGCPNCEKLYKNTQKAVSDLDLDIKINYITDIQKIITMGLMQSPVLTINDNPVVVGSVPDIEKIKEIIKLNI